MADSSKSKNASREMASKVKDRLYGTKASTETDLDTLKTLGNRDEFSDEEHLKVFDRVAVMRERLKTGIHRKAGAQRLTDDEIESIRQTKDRKALEAEEKAKKQSAERLTERRDRMKRTHYFTADDEKTSSDQLMRRPSEKNPGFNDIFIPKGEVLFHEGQLADCIYLIDDGAIEIFSSVNNRSYGILKTNQIFGEQSLLYEGRRGASARALTDTRCLEVEGVKWRNFLSKQSRPANLGFKALMLEQIQKNYIETAVSGSLQSSSEEARPSLNHEIPIPELYLFDPLDPLALPDDRRDSRHLHTLFSEIAFGMDDQFESLATSASLNKLLKSTGIVVISGQVEIHLDEKVFFGGPGAVLGVAASMAGVDCELSVSLPDGSEGIEYLPIDGSQCFAEIRRLKSALVRFTRAITMRCLGLKSVPIGMK